MFNTRRRGIFVKQDKSPDTKYNGQDEKEEYKQRILVNEAVGRKKSTPAVKYNMQENGKINGAASF